MAAMKATGCVLCVKRSNGIGCRLINVLFPNIVYFDGCNVTTHNVA